jgi:hypothetical protein
MTPRIRLLSLALAVAINGAALVALHHAIDDGAERARVAAGEIQRVLVSAKREPAELAGNSNCPAPKAL